MPRQVERLPEREAASLSKRGSLPQDVIKPNAPLTALPTPEGRRKVDVDEVKIP
jgi:hypothetical protein